MTYKILHIPTSFFVSAIPYFASKYNGIACISTFIVTFNHYDDATRFLDEAVAYGNLPDSENTNVFTIWHDNKLGSILTKTKPINIYEFEIIEDV